MTLTLNNDEVQQYFDMREDLSYYKQKVHELEEELDMLREASMHEFSNIKEEPISIAISEGFVPNKINSYWSYEDILILKDRIFYQGKYDKTETSVATIISLFPHRTEDGVRSKIYDLGGRIKAGQVYPRIKK